MGGDEYRRSNRDSGAPEPSISHHRDPDPIRPEDSDEFREQFGYVRSYYRLRPEKHTNLQRWLNQARFGQNYDAYLERTAIYAILAAVIGVLAGVGLTYALLEQGVIASLSNPLAYRGDLTVYLGAPSRARRRGVR